MILLDETMPRQIKRNALGLKNLVIDEAIQNGSEVVWGFNADTRDYILKVATEEELEERKAEKVESGDVAEEDIICLVDEFSPVTDFNKLGADARTVLDIVFHGDDYMQVSIIKGGIFIKEPVLKDSTEPVISNSHVFVYRDSPFLEESNLMINPTKKWISISKLKSYCSCWGTTDSAYVEDISYRVEVSLSSDGIISLKPLTKTDISLGELDKVKKRELENKQRLEASKLTKQVVSALGLDNEVIEDDEDEDTYDDFGTGSILPDEFDSEYYYG